MASRRPSRRPSCSATASWRLRTAGAGEVHAGYRQNSPTQRQNSGNPPRPHQKKVRADLESRDDPARHALERARGRLLKVGGVGGSIGVRIFRIVLSKLGQLRAARRLDEQEFQSKLHRLAREELAPRNLNLLVRDLQDGTTRFIIQDRTENGVCDLVDCPPTNGDGAIHPSTKALSTITKVPWKPLTFSPPVTLTKSKPICPTTTPLRCKRIPPTSPGSSGKRKSNRRVRQRNIGAAPENSWANCGAIVSQRMRNRLKKYSHTTINNPPSEDSTLCNSLLLQTCSTTN